MERVTIYLRTALFSFGGPDAHVPPGIVAIDAEVVDRPQGSLTVRTKRLFDDRYREMSTVEIVLQLPWSKIDHVQLID